MTMRLHRLLVLAVILAAAVTAGGLLVPAQIEAAGVGSLCGCSDVLTTSVMNGFGFTYTDATNDLSDNTSFEMFDVCFGDYDGFCNESGTTLVITQECRAFSSTQVQVTGYEKFRCKTCRP
jgi:hypothetical protein